MILNKGKFLVLGLATFGVLSCGKKEEGNVIRNVSKFISGEIASSLPRPAFVGECNLATTQCTPTGFSGQVYAASAMIGEKVNGGLGQGAYAMTFLAASEEIINRPDQGKGGSLTFDLSAPSNFSGLISIPTEEQMPSQPYMDRVEIAFDYLDTTFSFGSGALAGNWTVRTVFVNSATLDGKAVTGGDLLLKSGSSGEWKWCDNSGCTPDRPASPYQLATAVAALAQAANADGNQNYAYYSVTFETPLEPTYAQLSDTTRLWTLDFNLNNAIVWAAQPSTFSAEKQILENFTLPYACNYTGCPDAEGISATLTIGDAGSAPAAL